MLNFNRFKYRRKACLEFLSPSRNENKYQPGPDAKHIQGRKEDSGASAVTQNGEAYANRWSCSAGRSFSSLEPSQSDAKSLPQDGLECCKSSRDVLTTSDGAVKFVDSSNKRPLGHQKRQPSGSTIQLAKDKKHFSSGEDRLSSILCNGFSGQNSFGGNEDEENAHITSRKRKEWIKNSPYSSKNDIETKDEEPAFFRKYVPGEGEFNSKKIVKPRRKRRKVILLDDSSDSDNVDTDGDQYDISVSKEADDIKGPLKIDVEKLREIYPHLTTAQAKEAIEHAGSLTDAILNLADTLDNGDDTQSSCMEKRKPKEKSKSKQISTIVDSSDELQATSTQENQMGVAHYQNSGDQLSSNDENEEDDQIEYKFEEMTEEQSMIWSFFQEASVADIGTVPGCSEKKAAEIIKHRPFKHFHDLFNKVSSIRGISTRIVEDSINFINEQTEVDKLLVKCQTISKRIGKAIRDQSKRSEGSNVTEVDFLDSTFLAQQPSILNSSYELKHYQLSGLNWLITLHNEGVNGILADQMGLGKTIQALAFLGYLIENGNIGPHVIIVPSSTCDNWLREIETWLPTVSYIQYKGSQDERFALREKMLYGDDDYNIIISTYNIAISTAKDRSLFRKLKSHYLILDEAHMLKNMKSNRYKYLMDIKSKRRLLLTGTPLQNNLIEMISLLSFLMPDFFVDRINGILTLFGSKSQSSYQERIIKTAKKILKPFILRRTKSDVLNDLPKKVEKLVYCDLVEKQRKYYDELVAKYKSLDSIGEDYRSALGILMQLRKVSNHPLLERYLYGTDLLTKMARDYCDQLENRESSFQNVLEDMEVMSDFELHNLCREKYYLRKYSMETEALLHSGKFNKLDELLPELKETGCRVLLFSQFTTVLDIAEPYLKFRKYKYLRLDGQTPVAERQALIDEYNTNEDLFIFLLSTRAGGVGINLTAANAVILHDIDFNPYNDKQAEDRCHRVGQKRDVTVYKLISKDTIEESILACARSKLHLEQNVAGNFDEDESSSEDVFKYLMANIS